MAAIPSAAPIVVPGQLTLRTIRGRNGPFNVSRLVTSIGEFVVKDPELEQYPEGKYEGEFVIRYIFPKVYPVSGGMRFEMRANLDGMTLSGIEKLGKEEARKISPQEVDPLDEEQLQPVATPASGTATVPASKDPLVDITPFGVETPATSASAAGDDDAALFGAIWPLAKTFKLDSTADRRVLRQQRDRLYKLGYDFAPLSQEWHLVEA